MGWRDAFQGSHSTEIPEKSERLSEQRKNISDISHFSVAIKAGLLDELTKRGVLPKDLERRIELVAKFYGFTTHELAEAKEIAAGDVDSALICFRALAAKAGLRVAP